MLAGINSLLDAVATILFSDATYYRRSIAANLDDPLEPGTETITSHACKAQIDDGSRVASNNGGAVEQGRFILLQRSSLPFEPAPNDEIETTIFDGTAKRQIIAKIAEIDPAGVYYRLEIKS